MATRVRAPTDRRPSHPPLWLVEGLDIVQRRRLLLAAVTLAVIAVATVVSVLLPTVLPPRAWVGAAIGFAALLLGLAAAIGSDATDLLVRGPRHVAAAGGELVAVLPHDATVAAARPLATAVLEARTAGQPILLGFATAGRDTRRVSAWADALGRALVEGGAGVLRVELAAGRSQEPGLREVIREGRKLPEVVTFEPDIKLAHLSAGGDHLDALACAKELPARLPRDLDVLLVSLPTAVSRTVVSAAGALDHLLVVVERDRTSRVDLIASLNALDAGGTEAQVVLLDTATAMRLAPPVPAAREPERPGRRTIASTVGAPPVLDANGEQGPVAVADEPLEPLDVDDVEVAAARPEAATGPEHVDSAQEEGVAGADATAPAPMQDAAPPVATATAPGARDPALIDAAIATAARDRVRPPEPRDDGPVAPQRDDGPVAPQRDDGPASAAGPAPAPSSDASTAAPHGRVQPAGTGTDDALSAEDPRSGDGTVDLRGSQGLDEDDTDRLDPVHPVTAGDRDDEHLHTTAQLALLAQELAEREQHQPATPDTRSSEPKDG